MEVSRSRRDNLPGCPHLSAGKTDGAEWSRDRKVEELELINEGNH